MGEISSEVADRVLDMRAGYRHVVFRAMDTHTRIHVLREGYLPIIIYPVEVAVEDALDE